MGGGKGVSGMEVWSEGRDGRRFRGERKEGRGLFLWGWLGFSVLGSMRWV